MNTENNTNSKTEKKPLVSGKVKQKKLQSVIQKVKQNKTTKVSYTFKFDSDLSNLIERIVKEENISKTELVEGILKDYLL